MRNLCSATVIAVLALVPAACNKSPEGGTPGTENSFTITTAPGDTNVPQGGEKTVTITIRRDDKFTANPITLKAEPQGDKISAEFVKSSMEVADKEAVLKVSAEKDAPLGERTIKVTATPKTGQATTLNVEVEVVAPGE